MRSRPQNCAWCGREVSESELGRRKKYCRRSCRQRAYEQRAAVHTSGFPEGSVVLSATEVDDLADRAFAARCAAEDVATAIREGAHQAELLELARELVAAACEAERLR